MKKLLAVLLAAALLVSLAGCGFGAGANREYYIDVDYDKAEEQFTEYLNGLKLPTYFGLERESVLYDVNDDGYDDLISFPSYGSGMPRTSVAVFDAANRKGYILDSYNWSYGLESCDGNGLVITKYEVRDQVYLSGTIVIKDGELLFIEK